MPGRPCPPVPVAAAGRGCPSSVISTAMWSPVRSTWTVQRAGAACLMTLVSVPLARCGELTVPGRRGVPAGRGCSAGTGVFGLLDPNDAGQPGRRPMGAGTPSADGRSRARGYFRRVRGARRRYHLAGGWPPPGHRHRSGGGHRGRHFPNRARPWSRTGVLVRYRGRSHRGHRRSAASRSAHIP